MEGIQPAAKVSNFSSSSELKLLWIIEDRDYPFSAKQLYWKYQRCRREPAFINFVSLYCVFLPSTLFSIEGKIAVKASWFLEEVSTWKCTSWLMVWNLLSLSEPFALVLE